MEEHSIEALDDSQAGRQGGRGKESNAPKASLRRSGRDRRPNIKYEEEEENPRDEEEAEIVSEDWEHPLELRRLLRGPLAREISVIVSRPGLGAGGKRESVLMGAGERGHRFVDMGDDEEEQRGLNRDDLERIMAKLHGEEGGGGRGDGGSPDPGQFLDVTHEDEHGEEEEEGEALLYEGDGGAYAGVGWSEEGGAGDGLNNTEVGKPRRGPNVSWGVFTNPETGALKYYCRHRCGQYLVNSKGRRKHEKQHCRLLKEGSDPDAILMNGPPEGVEDREEDYVTADTPAPGAERPRRKTAVEYGGNGAFADPVTGVVMRKCRNGCGGVFNSKTGQKNHERLHCKLAGPGGAGAPVDTDEEDDDSADPTRTRDPVSGAVRFLCQLGCGKTYSNKKSRRTHERKHCKMATAAATADHGQADPIGFMDVLDEYDDEDGASRDPFQSAAPTVTPMAKRQRMDDDADEAEGDGDRTPVPCRNECGVILSSNKKRWKHERHHCKYSAQRDLKQEDHEENHPELVIY